MQWRNIFHLTMGILSTSALTLGGCDQKSASATGGTPTAAAAPKPTVATKASPADEAKKIYTTRCTVCHGAQGKGDGAGAAALKPKPANFASAEWQAQTKDDELKKAIVEGGPAVGKSPGMAPNPDLKGKPEVVDELVKMIRGFKS